VTKLCALAELCLPLARVGGCMCALKTADGAEDELREGERSIATLGGRLREMYGYELPGLGMRCAAVIIEKVRPTPAPYPRRWAKIIARMGK